MSHSSLAFTGDNSWKLFSSNFKAILRGSSFCTFGGVLYKTKTMAKFVENRKYYRSYNCTAPQ